jgi:predicted nucleotidyltransferase
MDSSSTQTRSDAPTGDALPDDAVVKRFVRDIVAAVQPLRILLFGSRARCEAEPESDLDLLVVVPEGTDRRKVAMDLYEDIPRNGTAMDVLVATPSVLERHRDNPGLIYRTILEEGREVYAA